MNSSVRSLAWLAAFILLVAGGAGCSKRTFAERLLESGNRYFELEQYDKAETEYLRVLRFVQLQPTALGKLGLACFYEGKLPQSFAFLRKAAELDPGNAAVRLKLGLAYFALHQPKEAWAEAAWVLQKHPTDAEALTLLADSASTTNAMEQTRRMLDACSPAVKAGAAYHLARSALLVRRQDLDGAEAEVKAAVAREPKSSAAHHALASLCLLRNDPKRAEPEFKTAAELAPWRAAGRLNYAEFELSHGAAAEAKAVAAEITQKAPDYVPAWAFLARVALLERKNDDCAALLRKTLAADPINYDALMLNGELLFAKGQATNALTHFEHIASLYSGEPRVQLELAIAHLLNRDARGARSSLYQALAMNPEYPDAILLLAEIELRSGESFSAIGSLGRLIKRQPQLPQAYQLLATAYLAQRNADAAIATYRQMAEILPKDAQVPLLIGLVLAQQNKRAEARQAFESSLRLSPDYLPALEQIVDLDLADKHYDLALQRVEQQRQKNPKAAEAWLLAAKIHLAQATVGGGGDQPGQSGQTRTASQFAKTAAARANVDQAEQALLKAIELNPNLRKSYLLLAQLYVASEKHQQALDRLNGYVAKTNDVVALMQIGMIHDQLQHVTAAREAYERLLNVDPSFSPALNNLAYLYSERLGQLDKAYAMAERARGLLPYDPYTADTLGWILYKRAEYPRALGLIEESAFRLPANAEVQFHLGMTHYMLGEEQPARLALERAVRDAADFPGKEEGRARLATLAISVKTADASVQAALEKRLRSVPNDPIALSRLAAIQERDGAFGQAAKTIETALRGNPQNAALLITLAQLYAERLNDAPKALRIAREAHSLASDDPAASSLLGRLVFQAGDYPWAASLLEEASRKLPRDFDVLYDLAWARYSLGRVAEAQDAMRNALAALAGTPRESPSPGRQAKAAEARRFLDFVAASGPGGGAAAGSPESMARQVQQVLASNPDYVPGLVLSAMFNEQRGNFKEAARLYERVLARYPQFAPATRNLAFLEYERLGDDSKAFDLAKTARESFPGDVRLARMLGILAYQRGDCAWSAELLAECEPKPEGDAEVFYYLGMARYRLKEPARSKAALERALALNVQPKLAQEAKRILAEFK